MGGLSSTSIFSGFDRVNLVSCFTSRKAEVPIKGGESVLLNVVLGLSRKMCVGMVSDKSSSKVWMVWSMVGPFVEVSERAVDCLDCGAAQTFPIVFSICEAGLLHFRILLLWYLSVMMRACNVRMRCDRWECDWGKPGSFCAKE
jgi:hypothetical protein